MDKRTKQYIINALRKTSRYSPSISRVRQRARLDRGIYRCEFCDRVVGAVDIDHKEPVVRPGEREEDWSWDRYIDRLFCGEENLWALCRCCHVNKSSREAAERKRQRQLEKARKNAEKMNSPN